MDRSSSRGVISLRSLVVPRSLQTQVKVNQTFSCDVGLGLVLVMTAVSGVDPVSCIDVDPVKSVARGYPMKRVPHVFIDSSAFKRSRRIGSPSSWLLSEVSSLASKKTCLGSFLPDESHALTCVGEQG